MAEEKLASPCDHCFKYGSRLKFEHEGSLFSLNLSPTARFLQLHYDSSTAEFVELSVKLSSSCSNWLKFLCWRPLFSLCYSHTEVNGKLGWVCVVFASSRVENDHHAFRCSLGQMFVLSTAQYEQLLSNLSISLREPDLIAHFIAEPHSEPPVRRP